MREDARRVRLMEIIRERSFKDNVEITLASGRKSNFYFNMKPTMLHPEGAGLLAELVLDALVEAKPDFIGGLEMGAVPIVSWTTAASFLRGAPVSAFFVRKKAKDHGAKLLVEGLAPGETLQGKRVVIVEDVTTTGESALKAVEAVREAGGQIMRVVTLIDRQEGAQETMKAAELPFTAIFKAAEFRTKA
ncbi:orotate phosphoribosyltransferase [Rhodoligotrophos appendicifer]|uniref:orotate phosphoribosyltransferase n=1 Tax=Rhodoligotrophos appendicifer TaxID=987056 RepID=UPI00117DED28|nr:orotate phosphoribosyltransferase [Rhodoligotrophos appendicifer]